MSGRWSGGRPILAGFDPNQFRDDRLDAGLRRHTLARLAGTMWWTIARWETGERVPSQKLYRRVMDVIQRAYEEKPASWLWRRDPDAGIIYQGCWWPPMPHWESDE